MVTGSFPGVKSIRGVTLTPHPLPVPWSRKSRAIPLLPVWAVRPVQSLSVCTIVHSTFTCYLISTSVSNVITSTKSSFTFFVFCSCTFFLNRQREIQELHTVTQWRTEGGFGVFNSPSEIPKALQNRARTQPDFWKLLKIAEFRTPTPQDVRKKGSKILKLPRFTIVLH